MTYRPQQPNSLSVVTLAERMNGKRYRLADIARELRIVAGACQRVLPGNERCGASSIDRGTDARWLGDTPPFRRADRSVLNIPIKAALPCPRRMRRAR